MDEKVMVEWSQTAQELARIWHPSMRSKSRVKIDEDDIRDFLIDIWLEKGGQGMEFEEANRGRLYSYVLISAGHSRDALSSAHSMSEMRGVGSHGDDEGIDEDRLDFLSYSDPDNDGGFDDEPQAHDDLLGGQEDAGQADGDDALDQRLEELAAIRDSGLAGALSEVFGISDRRCRSFSAEIRSEKALSLLVDAAKKRGMKPAEVKNLAAEIAAERRKTIDRANAAGGDLGYHEIEVFEEMMGLVQKSTPTPTARTVKNRLTEAKRRRKSAPQILKVLQQQSIPTQLELVEQPPSRKAGSRACRQPGPAR